MINLFELFIELKKMKKNLPGTSLNECMNIALRYADPTSFNKNSDDNVLRCVKAYNNRK